MTPPAPVVEGWPVAYESLAWEVRAEDLPAMSNRERRRSRGPYEAAVPPQIAELPVTVSASVATEAAEATRAISRFDEKLAHRLDLEPDEEVSPLSAVLLRTESASSSQIEEITAGAKALALAAIAERTGPNAQLVAANADAMTRAVSMVEGLTPHTLIELQRALLERSAPELTGGSRDLPIWMGGRGSTPHSATFVPPRFDRVPPLIDVLIEFCDRTDVESLTRAAIAHAQFETIHPFPDGNGRVGRALVHAMLRSDGVTHRSTVPVSAGLLADVEHYFAALTEYREGRLDPIVSVFTDAAFAALSNGERLVDDLATLNARWHEALTRRGLRRDALAWRVLTLLFSQPAVTNPYLQQQTGAAAPTTQRAVDTLVEEGILMPEGDQRRSRVWVAREVTDALDAFALRSGRRGFQPG